MKQKGFAPIITLIFIALAVATAYFLGTKDILKLPTSLPLSILSPSPTPTPDPTANWKTYTNIENAYQISYPYDWYITKPTCSECALNISNLVTNNSSARLDPKNLTLGILVFSSDSQNLADWKNVEVQEQSNFTWSNIQGLRRVEKRDDFFQLGENILMEVLYVEHGNKTYVFYSYPTTSGLLLIQNQILSTFKFTQ